jgi:ectoine hydroxylase
VARQPDVLRASYLLSEAVGSPGSDWNAECVAHRLTDAERDAFERDGYLLVPEALDSTLCGAVHDAARTADTAFRAELGVGPHHVLNQHGLLGRAPAYLDLVDLATTFPKVWGILGWHIQVFHTQLIVTPPAPAGAHRGAYGWHQDNNRMNLDLAIALQPRISLKVGYFLSDLPMPGMGNLCVVPASHRAGRPKLGADEQPDGAIELTARAGDAVIFDRRLWHSASTNASAVTRVFVTVGYSHRWLRPKSEMDLTALRESVGPIRRQLLGATSSANGWYEPTPDDVPLREWIRVHLGERAVAE